MAVGMRVRDAATAASRWSREGRRRRPVGTSSHRSMDLRGSGALAVSSRTTGRVGVEGSSKGFHGGPKEHTHEKRYARGDDDGKNTKFRMCSSFGQCGQTFQCPIDLSHVLGLDKTGFPEDQEGSAKFSFRGNLFRGLTVPSSFDGLLLLYRRNVSSLFQPATGRSQYQF